MQFLTRVPNVGFTVKCYHRYAHALGQTVVISFVGKNMIYKRSSTRFFFVLVSEHD